MNKRILELHEQAHLPHTALDPSNNMPYQTTCFSAEKFAELIVRECLNEVKKGVPLAGLSEQRILKHFGVEE